MVGDSVPVRTGATTEVTGSIHAACGKAELLGIAQGKLGLEGREHGWPGQKCAEGVCWGGSQAPQYTCVNKRQLSASALFLRERSKDSATGVCSRLPDQVLTECDFSAL